jgi:hypothetical protein
MTALTPSLADQIRGVMNTNTDAENLGPINLEFMVRVGLAATQSHAQDKAFSDNIIDQVVQLKLEWARSGRKEEVRNLETAVIGNPDSYRPTWIRRDNAVQPMIYPACMTSEQAKTIYGLTEAAP